MIANDDLRENTKRVGANTHPTLAEYFKQRKKIMKIQYLTTIIIATSLLVACSQENAKSSTPNTAVSATAQIPNQPSEEARALKQLLERIQTERASITAPALNADIQTVKSFYQEELKRNNQYITDLKKISPKDENTIAFHRYVIQFFEQTTPIYEAFLSTGNTDALSKLSKLSEPNTNEYLSKALVFEAQFVKQPEFLLESAMMFEALEKLNKLVEMPSPNIDKSLPKQEKLLKFADYLENTWIPANQDLLQYFEKMPLTQPEIMALRDEYVRSTQISIAKEQAIMKRLREGKTEASEMEKQLEKQFHIEKLRDKSEQFNQALDKARANLK